MPSPEVDASSSERPAGRPDTLATSEEPGEAASLADTVTDGSSASEYWTTAPPAAASLVTTGAWTTNVCGTGVAGLKTPSPACEAVIVHSPSAPVRCTVAPDTVQTPLAEKVTGRPESELAETPKSGSPGERFGRAPNVIVWSARVHAEASL